MSDRFAPRLSEYLDDELGPDERRAVADHLATCPACREELAGLARLVGRYDTLAARGPERDLWPAIRGRLQPRQAASSDRRSRWPLAAAALAAATLLLALVLTPAPDRGGGAGPTSADAVGAGHSSAAATYVAAARALRGDLAAADLEAAVSEQLERDLAHFDEAIRETRRALAEDPADVDLQHHLVRTLRAQVGLLRRAEAGGHRLQPGA